MKRCGLILASILCALPIAGQSSVPSTATSHPSAIYLIGSAHNMHFEARYNYSLIDLQAEVRSLHPDVICGEITPDAFNGLMEGNFPPEAAMLAELAPRWGMRFVPADWRVSFALQAQAGKQEAENPKKATEVDAEQNKQKAYFGAFPGGSLYDYTNGSPKFQAIVDHMFEDVIGTDTPSDLAAGAWHERNRMIVRNCLAESGHAKRIVFVFGAAHMAQLKRQLAALGRKGEIPQRTFEPAGLGSMPQAVMNRWKRNLKNLEGVIDGTIPISADMRAKAQDTNRVPALRNEITLYFGQNR